MTVRKIIADTAGLKVAASTWGGTYSSHEAIRGRAVKFKPNVAMHAPGYMKPESMRGPDASVVGGQGGQLTFEVPMRGQGSVYPELARLLAYSGTYHKRPAGSGKVTSATVSTLVALTADIGDYDVGDAIMVTGTGTDTQIRFISRVQDDVPSAGSTTLTIEPNWADIPTSGDSIVAIHTWMPLGGEPSSYLEFLFAQSGGAGTDIHQFKITDCALSSWKLKTTDANALPFLELTFEADSWTSSETSMATSTDSMNPPAPLLGDKFYVDDSAILTESIGVDAGLKLSPLNATSGANGRSGWFYTGCEPKLEVKPYHDKDTWISYLTSATTFQGMFESIKDADEGWAIWFPKLQVVEIAPDALKSGLLGDNPTLLALDPGANTDGVNLPLFALAYSGAQS